MLTFTRLRRPAERGMDPHNARRPEQIIVADRERAAGYATGTCLSICGPDCDDHRCGICSPSVMDFRDRAKTDWRHGAVRSSSGLRANKTHPRIVFTTGERESNYLRIPYRGNINGGQAYEIHSSETFVVELSLNRYLNLP